MCTILTRFVQKVWFKGAGDRGPERCRIGQKGVKLLIKRAERGSNLRLFSRVPSSFVRLRTHPINTPLYTDYSPFGKKVRFIWALHGGVGQC